MPDQTTPTETQQFFDDSIRFLLPSSLKMAFRLKAIQAGEDMSDVLRRLMAEYVQDQSSK